MGYRAFGERGRAVITVVIFMQLFSAAVALTILFADSVNALFGINTVHLKILFGILMTPTSFFSLVLKPNSAWPWMD
jgi:solute carrier family 32 (vesicular inhibitory amino acid transporter)